RRFLLAADVAQRGEVNVFEARRDRLETRVRTFFAEDVNDGAAGDEFRRDDGVLLLKRFELALRNHAAPDLSFESANRFERLALHQHAAAGDDRHVRAEVADVFDDVRRKDDDDVLADLGEEVVKADALAGIESGRRRADDARL